MVLSPGENQQRGGCQQAYIPEVTPIELDGSGRQLPVDPQNFELHGLVDALNQASLRLAEQQRLAKINEHELRALTGNIPGVVYQSLPDPQFTMEHLSQEFERLAGYPVAELIDNRVRSYAGIIHPADVAKVRELRENAIEQRRPFAAEYRLRASDGSTRWVLDKGQGVFGDRGELMHLTGVIINDTARHSALSALARSEVRHRRLVENLSVVVWQSDTEARVSLVNRAWLQVSGLPPEQLVGRRLFELIAEPDQTISINAWTRMLSGQEKVVHWQARIVTASGELRWGEFTARLTLDNDGAPNGVAGLLSDIHERKLLDARLREGEERLRESLELSRQLLEAMPHPVYYQDRNGRFRGGNRAWAYGPPQASKEPRGDRRGRTRGREARGSVSQTHGAGGLVAQVDADAEEVGRAGGFAALAAHAVFGAGRRGDLAGLATVPGDHFEHIEGTGPYALGATDAGVVDLDGVGHERSRRSAWSQRTHPPPEPAHRSASPSPLFIRPWRGHRSDP
jgi:PAS domain S-box-containing protein